MNVEKQSVIQTSIHYPPIHKFTGYMEFRTNDLPLTDVVTATEVTLPMFPALTEDHKKVLIGGIHSWYQSSHNWGPIS